MFATLIPVAFGLTKRSAFDSAIGGLSYPLYLVHVPIYAAIVFAFAGNENAIYRLGPVVAASAVVTAFIVAALLHVVLERRMDAFRHRFRTQPASLAQPRPAEA